MKIVEGTVTPVPDMQGRCDKSAPHSQYVQKVRIIVITLYNIRAQSLFKVLDAPRLY